MTHGSERSYKVLQVLIPQLAQSYRHYGVSASFFPIMCAKFARAHATKGNKTEAKRWYEEAQHLWANTVCFPGHHCVDDIQTLIDNL